MEASSSVISNAERGGSSVTTTFSAGGAFERQPSMLVAPAITPTSSAAVGGVGGVNGATTPNPFLNSYSTSSLFGASTNFEDTTPRPGPDYVYSAEEFDQAHIVARKLARGQDDDECLIIRGEPTRVFLTKAQVQLLEASKSNDKLKFKELKRLLAPNKLQSIIFSPPVDPNFTDEYGWTPLHHAAQVGDVKVIKELLEANADILAETLQGELPLYIAAYYGHLEAMRLVLRKGNDPIVPRSKSLTTPIHAAISRGHVDVFEHLISLGCNERTRTNHGTTSLHFAAMNGREKIVRHLLDLRNDPNARQSNGRTAMHHAALHGHLWICQVLQGEGGDVFAVDKMGTQSIALAAQGGHSSVAAWCVANGCDINRPNRAGMTPLIMAVENGHLECVKYLVSAKADVNWAAQSGQTALRAAISFAHHDIASYLRSLDAKLNDEISVDKKPLGSGWVKSTQQHMAQPGMQKVMMEPPFARRQIVLADTPHVLEMIM